MNIDKIIADELRTCYLDKVEKSLKKIGLTFSDLKKYVRVGKSKYGISGDTAFKSYFGNDIKIPRPVDRCLCGHEITEQCYLCPEGSKNVDDIIIVGNKCINKWGYEHAVRGNDEKIKCNCCGATVNKSGIKRHQETLKCRSRRNTESNISTSLSFELMD
jgi:hypothetical protein